MGRNSNCYLPNINRITNRTLTQHTTSILGDISPSKNSVFLYILEINTFNPITQFTHSLPYLMAACRSFFFSFFFFFQFARHFAAEKRKNRKTYLVKSLSLRQNRFLHDTFFFRFDLIEICLALNSIAALRRVGKHSFSSQFVFIVIYFFVRGEMKKKT